MMRIEDYYIDLQSMHACMCGKSRCVKEPVWMMGCRCWNEIGVEGEAQVRGCLVGKIFLDSGTVVFFLFFLAITVQSWTN
jgi:hypothetical protein